MAGSFAIALDCKFISISQAIRIWRLVAARLLGVTLPENFRQPYHAATPPIFGLAGHMTLSRWIRDYLFFPDQRKWMGAPLPLYTSLLGVMTLVDYGTVPAGVTLFWALLHGAYLVLYRFYESLKARALRIGQLAHSLWMLATIDLM